MSLICGEGIPIRFECLITWLIWFMTFCISLLSLYIYLLKFSMNHDNRCFVVNYNYWSFLIWPLLMNDSWEFWGLLCLVFVLFLGKDADLVLCGRISFLYATGPTGKRKFIWRVRFKPSLLSFCTINTRRSVLRFVWDGVHVIICWQSSVWHYRQQYWLVYDLRFAMYHQSPKAMLHRFGSQDLCIVNDTIALVNFRQMH